MTVTRIKSVNPIRYAIIAAILYAAFGLIEALLFAPFLGLMAAMTPSTGGPNPFAGLSVGFILVALPISLAVIGFIGGLILALLYNLVAGWTGGIEMKLETVGATAP